MAFADLVGDDLSGGDIFNRGQMPHGSPIYKPTEITAPHVMRLGDGSQCRDTVLIGVLLGRDGRVALDPSPWRPQIVFGHNALRSFVIDP